MKRSSIELQKVQARHRILLSNSWSFWLIIIMWATLISCEENNGTDISSPNYFILESEKVNLPAAINLPNSTSTRIATYYAKGVQVYNAQQKPESNPPVYEWVFVSPIANLFNEKNELVGSHFAGPTWQLKSGDIINGQQFTPAKTASVDSNSIDWLLLKTKSGSTPTGIFKDVCHIQRIVTVGGKTPTTVPTSAAQTVGVEYTAVYRFTKEN